MEGPSHQTSTHFTVGGLQRFAGAIKPHRHRGHTNVNAGTAIGSLPHETPQDPKGHPELELTGEWVRPGDRMMMNDESALLTH
jgi:hypothetical protein